MGSYSYKDEFPLIKFENNNIYKEKKSNSNSNYSHPERSIPINDDQAIMKQSLKVLYKNNFVSLTFEDLHAFVIQVYYRQHLIKNLKQKRRGIIDVIYTPLGVKANNDSRNDSIIIRLDIKKYPYRCYDLTQYKNLIKIVEQLGGKDKLPMVFINKYYIGGADNFQELEDKRIIPQLLNKEYERKCLSCNIYRGTELHKNCSFCFTSFLDFAKDEIEIDVYEKRVNEKSNFGQVKTIIKK